MPKSPFTKKEILVYSVKDRAKTLKVLAWIIGDYGVHETVENSKMIAVTHVPTGMQLYAFNSYNCMQKNKTDLIKQAKAVAIAASQLPAIQFDYVNGVLNLKEGTLIELGKLIDRARREPLF